MTNGMALDTFWIQDAAGGAFDAPHRLARLSALIEQALSGRLRLAAEIRKASRALLGSRMRAIHVPPRVVVDNHASNTHTVVEVNGAVTVPACCMMSRRRSANRAYRSPRPMSRPTACGPSMFSTSRMCFGLKVENERKLARLREALLSALRSPEDAMPKPPLPRRRREDAA